MRLILILMLIACCLAGNTPREKQAWQLSGFAQGTSWHITYYSTDSIIAQSSIDSILTKLDSSLSIYKPWSIISRFNQCEQSLEIDEHLASVVRTSFIASQNTYGIFDITIQPVTQAWGFGPTKVTRMPDTLTISNLMQCVDMRYLSLQGPRLIKQKPCVSIDVNGIAQGYSVDVLARYMESKGIVDYMIEIGGELRIKGLKYPGAKPMRIGIEAPAKSEFEPSLMQRIITPADGAVTTSGSYRKFFESGGQKVSHIIDARTGFPARNELISVTVWAADAITADAYDNALMAMGLEKAFQFLQQHPELAAYFIYREKDGRIADTASTFFDKFMSVE